MGLGKSLQALRAIALTGEKALIIAPTYLVWNWKAECAKFIIAKVHVFDPKTSIPNDTEIIIASYTQLKYLADVFPLVQFVVADEFHYCKNHDTERSRLMYQHMSKTKPKYFLGLTGTPIKNRIPEIHFPLVILALGDKVLNKITDKFKSFYLFCYHFTNPRQVNVGNRVVVKYEGQKNIDELKGYLKNRLIRRKADDVLYLPEIITNEVEVQYEENPELQRCWEEFTKKGVIAESSVKAANARIKSRFTSDYVLGLLESGVSRVVVFTEHVTAAREIFEYVGKKSEVHIITGEHTMGHRQEAIERFEIGDVGGSRVLVATIGSCSTGVNLVAANHVVFNDSSWVPGDMLQAIKRIHRIGQNRTCFVTYIIGSTIDKSITRTIVHKMKVIDRII